VQKELLDKYSNANLRIYAVWFSMMPADSRAKWSAAIQPQLAPDSAWDGGEVLWDAYLLYASDAKWDAEPTGLIHWGRTIVAARDSLRTDFDKVFAK